LTPGTITSRVQSDNKEMYMERWLDEQVAVMILGEKKALVGKLAEVDNGGIVLEVESNNNKFPKAESLAVLAYVPKSKVTAILKFK
jgi:ribosome maturation factor RimP